MPLSSKCSLEQYAHKLLEKGRVIAYIDVDSNAILSARGFYCNDKINKTAYGTMMSSLPEARGMGLAKKLILKMFEICSTNGMNKVISSSVNPIAIHLYRSLGYEEVSSIDENGISTVKLSYKLRK
ncbi:MAG: GNAT family N-acetyltransferase [Bacteroides sp.]|nr:GNAT family N-acetyltransferase [Bacteroides sp.]